MIEARRKPRFFIEAPPHLRIRAQGRSNHLQRDIASEPRVVRTVDLAHAAASNKGTNRIGAEPRTRRQCHHDSFSSDAFSPRFLINR